MSEAESGEPLTGVSVKIKGTGKGTVTDGKGQYKIAVDVNQVLEFSFLGMTTQQIVVKSSTAERLNIVMRPDQLALEDVVVVGYGVTKKTRLGWCNNVVET
ncbi:carboxypeptidase-like regulatory domain-containing protein [Segatella oris]|uniref:carboxypeptidase-like regulatory domain-containing protein n=1 Tax=Segatella oris TaxID=28135 RepID=UPI0002EB8D5E|nr:carboxypeptidase-like regulatory domain-containing protein [Segatella oris]